MDPCEVLILLGCEQNGLSQESLAAADRIVTIPLSGPVRSLNLATACGIMMYALKHPTEKPNTQGQGPRPKSLSISNEKDLSPGLTRVGVAADAGDLALNVSDEYKGKTIAQVRQALEDSRSFPTILFLFEPHSFADRNLGGIVRVTAAFNQEMVMYCGKKKWDRRSAVGLQNFVDIYHCSDVSSMTELLAALDCKVVRLLQPGEGYLTSWHFSILTS